MIPISPTTTSPECKPALNVGTSPNFFHVLVAPRFNPFAHVKKAMDAEQVSFIAVCAPVNNNPVTEVLIDLPAVVKNGVGDVCKKFFEQIVILFVPKLLGDGGEELRSRNMKIRSSVFGL